MTVSNGVKILNRHKMDVLRRRLDYLSARIANSPIDLSHDKAELAALGLALDLIEAHGLCTTEALPDYVKPARKA